MKQRNLLLMFLILLTAISPAKASVMINEVFADPAADLTGDANNDGVRSGSDDEFIEILNASPAGMDISGWSLADNVSTRHIFPLDTILSPYSFLVIFGGGSPLWPDIHWQIASSGALGLNNSGDTVSLFDDQSTLINQVIYGSIGDKNQSITRFPDGEGSEFVLHSSLREAQGALFSPGMSVDSRLSLALVEEEVPPNNPVVPELPAIVYYGFGWGALLLKRQYL
ncbi:MAG: lamin tail domain-containing protein [Candidatus Omnitrophica bacterium]|nr:lamin tail domain-containing protein [Candidatus Omnitrophota bacterium]